MHIFLTASVFANDAVDFAKQCFPGFTPDALHQFAINSGRNNVAVMHPADQKKSYLAVTNGNIYCVQMSDNGYPIIPLAFYDGTIDIPGMPSDLATRLRTDLSRQISVKGFAHAWVINEVGNAYEIIYFIASNQPAKIYYASHFVKQSDIPQDAHVTPYHTVGGFSHESRGPDHERVKLLFAN